MRHHRRRSSSTQYRVKLLAEEVASQGKVVHAFGQGQDPISYTCRAEDSSVAVVWVGHADNEVTPSLSLGPIMDPDGKLYAATLSQRGHLCFVAIQRGFSKQPVSVTVPIQFPPENPFRPAVSFSVTVKKFAPVKRCVEVPLPAISQIGEKTALVENVTDQGLIGVKIVEKLPPGESYRPTLLATSFCQLGSDRVVGADYSQVCYSPDAARIRLDLFQKVTVEESLVYRNAEFKTMSGQRVLWLPTDQSIGSLLDCPASAIRSSEPSYKIAKLSHAQGHVNVFLSDHKLRSSLPGSELKCIGVSPSVGSMGLGWLEVSVDAYGTADLFKAKPGEADLHLTKVPELTIRFKTTREVKIGSEVLNLPVRKVNSDPELFAPAPMSNPAGGPMAIQR